MRQPSVLPQHAKPCLPALNQGLKQKGINLMLGLIPTCMNPVSRAQIADGGFHPRIVTYAPPYKRGVPVAYVCD